VSETTQSRVQQSNGKVETSHHPETDPKRTEKNYHGIPPIKHAHWTWQIPVYFWIGRISADDPEAYFTFASGESAPQPEDNI
jgi:hypothetical protein